MDKFTEQDHYILKELKKAGYGWQKFSESVISQGWISDKQRVTIRDMLRKLRSQQCDAQYRRSRYVGGCGSDDISDNEAMSLGEYF